MGLGVLLKKGDKVRVAWRFDRLIVREITQPKGAPWRLIRAEFESGYGQYTAPEFEFCKGWLKP